MCADIMFDPNGTAISVDEFMKKASRGMSRGRGC